MGVISLDEKACAPLELPALSKTTAMFMSTSNRVWYYGPHLVDWQEAILATNSYMWSELQPQSARQDWPYINYNKKLKA